MMTPRLVIAAAAALLCATAAAAQTPSELLEQGIFSQDTAGDLAGAIQIYERLASTPGVPREIAARAQVRLAEGRRRQATPQSPAGGSTPRVARSASAAENPRGPAALAGVGREQGADRCCGFFSGNYDAARAVTIDGIITRVEWANPETVVYVNGSDGNVWGFTTAAPNAMIRAGMNKDAFKVGDRVLVYGYLAKGIGDCPTRLPNACATLTNGAFHASASTITGSDGMVIFDRLTFQQPREAQERARGQAQ